MPTGLQRSGEGRARAAARPWTGSDEPDMIAISAAALTAHHQPSLTSAGESYEGFASRLAWSVRFARRKHIVTRRGVRKANVAAHGRGGPTQAGLRNEQCRRHPDC